MSSELPDARSGDARDVIVHVVPWLHAIQDRQQGFRRELEQLGRAIGLPQQRVHVAGRFDTTARVERECLVETRPREIRRASDVTGETRGVGRVEQQRRVIDAGDRGRVVD